MTRMCDTGYRECPRQPTCGMDCYFTTAELEPETRKVKAYPAVPDDIEPVPQAWQMAASVVVGFVLVVLVVIAVLFFFTGLWIWSLLI
jgi:hypothetical protein